MTERSTIGPYRVLRSLGRGGMGRVLEGVGSDGTRVAIKTVDVAEPRHREAIRREIRALARLEHPGIVRIVEEGLDSGVPWYSMELIPGVTLRRFLDDGMRSGGVALSTDPLAPPETAEAPTEVLHRPGADEEPGSPPPADGAAAGGAVDLGEGLVIVRSICTALSFLHGEGLVHRDLKPENVVLRADGAPVLVDFGLAVTASGREALAMTDVAAGTAGYVAPEQSAGTLVDARADLYALGCILFELAAGRLPYAGGAAQVLWQHRHAPVPALRDTAPGAPAALEELVTRLLAKDPAERIGYAEDVDAALAAMGVPAPPAATPASPPARAYLYRPSLVGRTPALAKLAERAFALEATSAGGMLLVAAEPGAGKTRLLIELAGVAMERGLCVLRGEASGGPLSALVEPLEQALDLSPDAAPAQEPLRAALAGYVPSLAGGPAAPELAPKEAMVRLFAAVAAVLQGAARQRPVLLLLDALERADDLTVAWLAHEARTGPRDGLLVIGALVPEGAPEALAALGKSTGVELVALEPLGIAEVARLIASMLSCREVPEGLPELLAARSGGNPHFVAEYLRLAVAQGLLRRSAGAWVVAPSASARKTLQAYEALPVPGSLRSLAQQRVQSLSPAAAHLLGLLALLGPAASPHLLDVLGEDAASTERAAHEIVARELAAPDVSGVPRVARGPLADAARAALPEEERRLLHRRVAELLGSPSDPAELGRVGEHWEEAGDAHRARAAYVEAARREMERLAFNDVVELLGRYLRLSRGPCVEDVDARILLGRALRLSGRSAEAVPLLQAALEEARRLEAPLPRSRAARGLSHALREQARVEESHAAAEEALAQARAAGDAAAEAAALAGLGSVLSDLGRVAPAREALEQALALNRTRGDRVGIAIALGTLGGVAYEEGRTDEAESFYQQCLDVSRRDGNRRGQLHATGNLAAIAAARGEALRARALTEESLAIARAIGDLHLEATLLGNVAVLDQRRGALTESVALTRHAMQLHREIGDLRMIAVTLGSLSDVQRMRGELAESRRSAEEALRLLRDAGSPRGEGTALRLVSEIAWLEGRDADALAAAEEALAKARQVGDRRHEALSAALIANFGPWRAAEAAARLEEPAVLLEAAADGHALALVLIDRAQHLREAGDLEASGAVLDRALRIVDRPDERYLLLHATCERGLLAAARGEDPAPDLARAESEAAAMGMADIGMPRGRLARLRQAVEGLLRTPPSA